MLVRTSAAVLFSSRVEVEEAPTFMSTVTIEVCSCCALDKPFIAEAFTALQAEYGDRLTVMPKQCLDICKPGAVKFAGEILTLLESDMPGFVARVRAALA